MQYKADNYKEVFAYITDFVNENKYSPSIRQICDAFNYRSTSTAAYYLRRLEEAGLIRRYKSRKRAIEIVSAGYRRHDAVAVSLVGRVAAGAPIFAEEHVEDTYDLPRELFRGEELFMLAVRGDSMINDGIRQDDKIIVQKQNYAKNGDIVVAMIGDEATVKRFYIESDGKIRLQPANDFMKPIIVSEVEILGVVTGLIRSY